MARPGRSPVLFFATGFCSGRIPVAPGTAGSAVGVLIFCLLSFLPLPGYLAATAAVTLCAVWAAGAAERILGKNDPPEVVIDEIAGQLIALATFPMHWAYMTGGFLLFRFFDILKPWPAGRINRDMHGGPGIVLDDVVAGLYANLVLQAARLLL